jgi:hypothetical protein
MLTPEEKVYFDLCVVLASSQEDKKFSLYWFKEELQGRNLIWNGKCFQRLKTLGLIKKSFTSQGEEVYFRLGEPIEIIRKKRLDKGKKTDTI